MRSNVQQVIPTFYAKNSGLLVFFNNVTCNSLVQAMGVNTHKTDYLPELEVCKAVLVQVSH